MAMPMNLINANKTSKIKYSKLMTKAIKLVTTKDIKKDMKDVNKNTMAQL